MEFSIKVDRTKDVAIVQDILTALQSEYPYGLYVNALNKLAQRAYDCGFTITDIDRRVYHKSTIVLGTPFDVENDRDKVCIEQYILKVISYMFNSSDPMRFTNEILSDLMLLVGRRVALE